MAKKRRGNGALDDKSKEAVLSTRLKDISEKVSKTREELTPILQRFEAAKLSATESTVGMLEKMLVSFRRITYYCKKLQETNGATAPETS